jgi:HK97 family phage prohead protease
MMHEHKSFGIKGLKADDQTGLIQAVVAVFSNVDSGNEQILPGFFTKSIARKLPKGVWMHNWDQPIAKTIEARELLPGDPLLPASLKGLGGAYIKGQFNLDTQRGREAYSDIKFGIVDEFSIGYKVLKESVDKNTGARQLIEGDWKEWSPVLVGMNSETQLLSIKSTPAAGTGHATNSDQKALWFLLALPWPALRSLFTHSKAQHE